MIETSAEARDYIVFKPNNWCMVVACTSSNERQSLETDVQIEEYEEVPFKSINEGYNQHSITR